MLLIFACRNELDFYLEGCYKIPGGFFYFLMNIIMINVLKIGPRANRWSGQFGLT